MRSQVSRWASGMAARLGPNDPSQPATAAASIRCGTPAESVNVTEGWSVSRSCSAASEAS